jgi:hypothetical protein
MILRRMKIEDATVHGFRSSFRDWAGNVSNFPREITETALSHVIGDKVEQAYRRSDALEKRRKLMDAWANYCEPRTTARGVGSTLGQRMKSTPPKLASKRLIAFVRNDVPRKARENNGHTAIPCIAADHEM